MLHIFVIVISMFLHLNYTISVIAALFISFLYLVMWSYFLFLACLVIFLDVEHRGC